jgi:hypothetical protein
MMYQSRLSFVNIVKVNSDTLTSQNSDSSPEEQVLGTDVEESSSSEVASAPRVAAAAVKPPASASVAVTRSTRRRSSYVQVHCF